MGAIIAGLGAGLAAFRQAIDPLLSPRAGEYPPVPNMMEPNVFGAGRTAARRAGQSSGRPQGTVWSTANRWVTRAPMLIGK